MINNSFVKRSIIFDETYRQQYSFLIKSAEDTPSNHVTKYTLKCTPIKKKILLKFFKARCIGLSIFAIV